MIARGPEINGKLKGDRAQKGFFNKNLLKNVPQSTQSKLFAERRQKEYKSISYAVDRQDVSLKHYFIRKYWGTSSHWKKKKILKTPKLTYTLLTSPSLLHLHYYKHSQSASLSIFISWSSRLLPMKAALQSKDGLSSEDVSMGEGSFNITTHPSSTSIKLFCSKFILSNSRSKLMLENANRKSTQTFTPCVFLTLDANKKQTKRSFSYMIHLYKNVFWGILTKITGDSSTLLLIQIRQIKSEYVHLG